MKTIYRIASWLAFGCVPLYACNAKTGAKGPATELQQLRQQIAALNVQLPSVRPPGKAAREIYKLIPETQQIDHKIFTPEKVREWAKTGNLDLGYTEIPAPIWETNYGTLVVILLQDALRANKQLAFEDIDAAQKYCNAEARSLDEINEGVAAQMQRNVAFTLHFLLLKYGSDPAVRSHILAELSEFQDLPVIAVKEADLARKELFFDSLKAYPSSSLMGHPASGKEKEVAEVPAFLFSPDFHRTAKVRDEEELEILQSGMKELMILKDDKKSSLEKVAQLATFAGTSLTRQSTYEAVRFQILRDSEVQMVRTMISYVDKGDKLPPPSD